MCRGRLSSAIFTRPFVHHQMYHSLPCELVCHCTTRCTAHWFDTSHPCCAGQAWRVCHPPQRGTWWLGRSPLVHRGFMIAWAANGLAKRVVAAIKQAVADSGAPASAMRILITGAHRFLGAFS